MKRLMIVSLLCLSVAPLTAIELVPEPTLAERLSYFGENVRDLMGLHPNAVKGVCVAVTVAAGYVAADYFDCLPTCIPSVRKVKRAIRKALPEQTPEVIIGEGFLALCVAYLLQDVPARIGSLFENPCPDGL